MKNVNLRYVRGRTLIELMIAMAIGLIIMLAVSTLYVTNTKTYRITDDKALLEEEGRLALNLMAFHLRMVGYGVLQSASPNTSGGGGTTNYTAGKESIYGCTGGFVSPVAASPAACNGGTGPDAFLVSYVLDSVNSNSASQGGVTGPADCIGQPLVGTPVVENRFYIQVNPATGQRELYCAGNGGVAPGSNLSPGQPIMDNVIDLKVTYGYDQNDDQSVDGFYTAASLMAGTTVPLPSYKNTTSIPDNMKYTLTSWFNKVLSAKICIVARSANDNLTTAPMSYRDCSGAVVVAADRRLYSTFSTVVSLRGRTAGRTI